MQAVIKVTLYQHPFTVSYISEDHFVLSDENFYRSIIGGNPGPTCEMTVDKVKPFQKVLKLKTSAFFLKPFARECVNSDIYRFNVLKYLSGLSGYPKDMTVFMKLILEPPDMEIIDYAWNDRMLKLVWTRVEIENAFSWLSTLGGAYSALGDYFEHCAEEAGRISVRQYKLSKMLGDDSLAARSKLYSALSFSQKGHLKLARHIVRQVAQFARLTRDKRLLRMCQGVWAKLQYLRSIKNNSKQGKEGLISCEVGDAITPIEIKPNL